jgi:uncharacterized MAPEG superfamily protein
MLGRLTLADLSILGAVIAYLLPIIVTRYPALRYFDNSKPRDPEFYKDPFRARGLAAHQNGMEGFAFFAAAVIIAQMRGASQPLVDGLAFAYLALRFIYVALYLANKPSLRSAAWGLAFAVNIAILLSASRG